MWMRSVGLEVDAAKRWRALVPLFLLAACTGGTPESMDAAGSAGEESGADGPQLILILDVDETLPRLDNFGEPADEIPPGHAAQHPRFRTIGASWGELVPTAYTPLGGGTELFDTPRREEAHEYAALPKPSPGEVLVSVPFSALEPGSYEYLRLALAFQRYEVEGHALYMGIDVTADVDIASFVDDELYIDRFDIGDTEVQVDAVKTQGYYAAWTQYTGVVQGQVPVGATTVPNPLDASSPIPVDSCVVTGVFDAPMVVTGDESEDRVVRITMSTNRSFEWQDLNDDGLWQPFDEPVADMGLRGMQLVVE